ILGSDDQVRVRAADLADERQADELVVHGDDALLEPERAQNSARSRPQRYDAVGSGAETGGPLPSSLYGHRVDAHHRARRLLALAARRPCEEQRNRAEHQGGSGSHATHCQSAHWTTATPSRSELTARIAAC